MGLEPMRAIVLAAGLGTRLRPLTDLLPKPAVPFFDRPLACWGIEHLGRAGIAQVVVNIHHWADRAETVIRQGAPDSVDLAFSREDTLLGTGGGLARAWQVARDCFGPPRRDEIIIAMNGDILFPLDLARVVEWHRSARVAATMVLRETANPWALGAVEVDGAGRVVSLLGRAPHPRASLAAMFTGVHVLGLEALRRLPDRGCVVRDGYLRWVAEGLPVGGVLCDEPWLDLGTPRMYRDAHVDVLTGRRPLDGIEARGSWVASDASVHPKARIEAAVIGREAYVGEVRVVRSVVWPGARLEEDVVDAIVLPDDRRVFV